VEDELGEGRVMSVVGGAGIYLLLVSAMAYFREQTIQVIAAVLM